MSNSKHLADLDELVLLCRDKRAQSYITEAVSCYKGGAYKSSVVATWVAVCYDIIDKVRELSLAGDEQAAEVLEKIERAREHNDTINALRMERNLLEVARDKFELISHLEFADLDRLREDRNRCAHPCLISNEDVFDATAELARLHLRHAVSHLLRHPPVQGKYALEQIVREVDSEYFPSDKDKAVSSFGSGPLARPRESLVRNLVVVLFKQLLLEVDDWKIWYRYRAALQAVAELHPVFFLAAFKEKFSSLARSADDERLIRVVLLLAVFCECWDDIDADVQTRIDNFVLELPADQLDWLDEMLEITPLSSSAYARLNRATRSELRQPFFLYLAEPVAERFIDIYLESKSFDQANDWGKLLAMYANDFTQAQQRRIIQEAPKNDQVLYSFELATVVSALRQSGKIEKAEFEALLESYGLSRLSESSDA